MNDLIFLDTETTGIDKEDRLLQVAYKYKGETYNELFKPPLPIKLPAMAVHHVTEKMVADKPAFIDSPTHDHLKAIAPTSILVAHNAKYDLGMLEKEGIEFPRHICTYKLAKHLDTGQYENHQMQYLRYFYGIEIEATAHDALGDILVLEQLFNIFSEQLTLDEMEEITKQPVLFSKFTFGKYDFRKCGMTIADVVQTYDGRQYLAWLLNEKKKSPEGEEDWIYTLNHYLNK
jgi:DNA polymerase III epsilon subunit-like protein